MPEQTGGSMYLSDLSDKDKPWDTHKATADIVQDFYRTLKVDKYADRISTCAELLEFALRPGEEGDIGLKLRSTNFCRVRHCPVCQWRRSMKWQAKMFQALPSITEAYPKHKWIFLTLTVRNCDLSELKTTLQRMNDGFRRLTELAAFPSIGWIKSVEVTRSTTGQAHPHYHCLLLVPSGYFSGKNYLNQPKWRLLWQQCMRISYLPVINIKTIKDELNMNKAICETLKYSVKESDLISDKDWLIELTKQLHKTRAISVGGVLREYLREQKEDEDLINIKEECEKQEQTEEDITLMFGWEKAAKRYEKQ